MNSFATMADAMTATGRTESRWQDAAFAAAFATFSALFALSTMASLAFAVVEWAR